MLITTTNEVAGYEIMEVLGEAFGLTVRSVAEAELKGANAILAMRFDTSELGSTWTEICAYGTAARIKKL